MQLLRIMSACAGALMLFALLGLSTIDAHGQQSDGDDGVIRVSSDLVMLNVTAVDAAGHHVSGLTASDFRILEDDHEQAISFFGTEETPFAAVVLLDFSSSMETRVSLARAAAINLLEHLRADDQVAVYSFDSKIESIQDFSTSRDLYPTAYGMHAKGMTVLYDAIVKAAKDLSQRPEKRRAIIVLSDGEDTQSSASFEAALSSASAANAAIYGINMAADDSPSERGRLAVVFKRLAEKSGGRFIQASGGPVLRTACDSIISELGGQYTIGYQPTNHARNGAWRAIAVNVKRPGVKAQARTGYKAQPAR